MLRASGLGFVLDSVYDSTFTSLCGSKKLQPREAIDMSIQICKQIMDHVLSNFSEATDKLQMQDIRDKFINYLNILRALVKGQRRIKAQRASSRTVRVADIIAHCETVDKNQPDKCIPVIWSLQARMARDRKCDVSNNNEIYRSEFLSILINFLYVILNNNITQINQALCMPEDWLVIEQLRFKFIAIGKHLRDLLVLYQSKSQAALTPQFIEIYFRLSGGKMKYIVHNVGSN